MGFIACLIPMAGALVNLPTYHIPVAMTFFVFMISLSTNKKRLFIKSYKSQTRIILFMFCILVLQLLTGRGFVILVGGGYMLLLSFFFYAMFSSGDGISIASIIRRTNFIYKFLMISLFIEFIIVLFGGQSLLIELFSSDASQTYKAYNSADILNMIGIWGDAGGLNSVLLGSQIAGMISLFATIWFIGTIGLSANKNNHAFWIAFSGFLFLCALNGTNMLLFIVALTLFTFKINQKRRLFYLFLFALITVSLFLLISNQIIFERVFSNEVQTSVSQRDLVFNESIGLAGLPVSRRDMYIAVFTLPIYVLLTLDWMSMFLGVGGSGFLSNYSFITGDNGFVTDVVLKPGLIWAIAFVTYIFLACFPNLEIDVQSSNNRKNALSIIGSVNALISILWLCSTIHYNQALGSVGGIALFSLHLALVIYCETSQKKLSKSLNIGLEH